MWGPRPRARGQNVPTSLLHCGHHRPGVVWGKKPVVYYTDRPDARARGGRGAGDAAHADDGPRFDRVRAHDVWGRGGPCGGRRMGRRKRSPAVWCRRAGHVGKLDDGTASEECSAVQLAETGGSTIRADGDGFLLCRVHKEQVSLPICSLGEL